MSYNKTLQIIATIAMIAGAITLTGCSATVLTQQENALQQQLARTQCSQGAIINVINTTQPDPRNYEVQLETEVSGNLAMMPTGSYKINVWHMDKLIHVCGGVGTGR